MTEWNEFRGLDLDRVRRVDGAAAARRRPQRAGPDRRPEQMGFEYLCTGRQSLAPQRVPA